MTELKHMTPHLSNSTLEQYLDLFQGRRKQTVSALSKVKANDVSTQANNFHTKHLQAGSAADHIQTTTKSQLCTR
jgi:hypothetical protein